MFDTVVPDLDELAGAHESMVVAAITVWGQIEAAAAARRLAAIAELVARRVDGDSAMAHWACDDWDAAAAEVGSALGVSHGKASSQMYLAEALRERLPRVAQAFADGDGGPTHASKVTSLCCIGRRVLTKRAGRSDAGSGSVVCDI